LRITWDDTCWKPGQPPAYDIASHRESRFLYLVRALGQIKCIVASEGFIR
jgi:hypothetical protein